MTTSGSTTARLLHLLSLLQAPRDWPGPALARRLDVSERTVRRDVDRLRAMGYVISADRGSLGCYRLEAGSQLPPLLLDEDQVTAVAVALRAVPLLGTDVDEAAERALATIQRVMPPRLRTRAAAVAFETAPHRRPDGTPRDTPVPAAVLAEVARAVRSRHVLRFAYAGGSTPADAPPRRVEPHHVVAARGRWYLLAWDLDRDDWRVFRLDRLTPRPPHGAAFVPRAVPGGDAAGLLAARFAGTEVGAVVDGPAGGHPCRGTVVLDLPARDVAPFAGDGLVEDLADGRTRLTAGSWSWAALAAALARFDADLVVEGPDELRDAFAALARRSALAAGPGSGAAPA